MKKCGTDFIHLEWGITYGQSIKVRRNIPKDKLTIFDRHYTKITSSQQQFPIAMDAMLEYLEKTCTELVNGKV